MRPGALFLSVGVLLLAAAQASTIQCDVCVYGGTSGGVTAAVQAARMGKSVVLVSDYGHLGGMSSSGLGQTDIGDSRIFGGLSKQFYQRIRIHYNGGVLSPSTPIQTTFEPHVAEGVFDQMAAEAGVTVIDGLIDLGGGVTMSGQRITALHLEDGTTVQAAMFIDACYEGDLMAQAGVTYTIGREANAQYGETGNGIRGATGGNQLPNGINPYVVAGDASSGLLPGVNADMGGATGGADHRLQAYCYRMCLTDVVSNRVTVAQPAGYDEADYELLFRAIEAGQTTGFWKTSPMPNNKTDSNNASGISCDFIGRNYSSLPPDHPDYWDWSTLNHAERAALAAQHRDWQLGLIWSVQNHPRVPQSVRDAWGQWGLPADEFTDNGHWPYNLYVREARRMISDYVMTEHNALGSIVVEDSVGMGAYTLDSHNTQRFVSGSQVKNEGDIQKGVAEPYPISYRSIVPATGGCENLLVPWCTSSSHIAFGSIRMEPVFMILGQSAATAACFAIDDGVAVQEVDYTKLSLQLDADAQVRYLVAQPPADPPEVWLFASDAAASEGNPADRAAITVGRTGSTAAELVLALGVSGTATPGSDYPALPATVTLAAGKTAVSIPIEATVDSVGEADEAIIVNLTVPGGYQAGASTSAEVTLHDLPPGDGSLLHDATTKISGGTAFNISVYPGKAGYAGTGTYASAAGAFGDGTVVAYYFARNGAATPSLDRYADDGSTILADPSNNTFTTNANFDLGDVWTASDPGTDFAGGAQADFGGATPTISGGYLVNGTIDISGFPSGTVYVLCGGYENPFQVDLTMSGPGLAPFTAGSGSIDPVTDRNMYVIAFDFDNASGEYDTITYSYTGSASNRSRFMGVVVDAGSASGSLIWSGGSTSNITATTADVSATINANLIGSTLVWDTADRGNASTADWSHSLDLGAQTAGPVTGQITGLSADTSYTWRLYGTDGVDEAWTWPRVIATSLTAAQAPEFTGAQAVANTVSIQLNWNDNANTETGYILQRSDNGTDFSTIATLPASTVAHLDSVPDYGKTYYYRLSAVNEDNGSSTDPALCETSGILVPIPAVYALSQELISSNSNFNISLFPGKAGYSGLSSGTFGDGTVEAYALCKNTLLGGSYSQNEIGFYATGGSDITVESYNGATTFADFDRGDVWTTSDPDAAPADFGGTTETISGGYEVRGSIDISGYASGTVYVLCGSYDNAFNVYLKLTGGSSPDSSCSTAIDPAATRNMYVLAFPFVAGDYTTIQYDYIGSASNRSRFMGVVVDAESGAGGTTYASWKTANSTTQTPDQDHDDDGVSNGVEYFLGGGGNTTGFTTLPGVTLTDGALSVTWTKAGDYPGTYGTNYWVETSNTLLPGSWVMETLGGNVTEAGNDVIYAFPAPLGSGNFARLKVTGP